MDFTPAITAAPRRGINDRVVDYTTILAALPDDHPVAVQVREALARVDEVVQVPLPADARSTARNLGRTVVEAVLSGKPFDVSKMSAKAIAEHDAQTMSSLVARIAREELGQHAAGVLTRSLGDCFTWWSDRLATLQTDYELLADEHGPLIVVDELAARRAGADAVGAWQDGEALRGEYDAVRAGFVAARALTDSDAGLRFRPEASYRHPDGSAVTSTDVTRSVSDVFASTHPMTAASGLGWICWAPSPGAQRHATEQRYARSA